MLMPAIRAIAYPCFCLWRGFWQITRTAPWRRMTLHFSHIGFTDARTFTRSAIYLLIQEKGRRGPGDGRAPIYSRRTLAGAVSAVSGRGGGIGLELMPGSKDARAIGRDG